jgi:hypothetical protein
MRRTVFLSAALLIVAACESPTRPALQPPPTPTPPAPAPAPAPAPPGLVDLRGNYTLTFEIGGGCEEVPTEFRTRSYEAAISYSYSFGSSDWFYAHLTGAKFHDQQQPVWMEATGSSVGVHLSDNVILEEASPGAYLATSGYGVASVLSTEVSTISGSFYGYFKYCAAIPGSGGTNQCSVAAMTRDMCRAENSRWTLTRR